MNWENFNEQVGQLPTYLGGHLILSLAALAVGILISVPAGILAAFSARARGILLTLASVIQTIPSLALLALMVPILGGTIGFLPAFLALTFYSILPTLRNTVTGIGGVDRDVLEAAHGMGMTRGQVLRGVQLPLAAPVILAGIRTSTVWVVGTATLSTPVGAPSLGNYIFSGLQTRNQLAILFGCVLAALLAILLDQLIRLGETALKRRRRDFLAIAIGGLAAVFVGGLLPGLMPAQRVNANAPQAIPNLFQEDEAKARSGRVRIGGKPFTEQYILANLMARAVRDAGFEVEELPNLGSTVLFDALTNNSVDVYIDYSGTIWSTVMKREGVASPQRTLIEVAAHLLKEHGVVMLGPLGFENAYGLAMRRDRAEEVGVGSLVDLGRAGRRLAVGGDYEFFGRAEWERVRDAYGLGGLRTIGMDPTLMYEAVRSGQVDLISAYTSDGRIAAFGLTVLEDPAGAFPPYDAIILLSPAAGSDRALVNALEPLVYTIGIERMRAANMRVDVEGASPRTVAGELYEAIKRPRGTGR